ncbi:two-component sensor histidine kinase [Salipaludibacillus neizhouensis]|uniref:histidine kinase n=1 Tax=Salipaludibacillus neizhouensis TaxID=885475 RepID=A0A3A9KAA2_9BACI|nr:HAMP domain-containing sensor histidine kinase [Salipaludibacillus neizhouensis]RKL67371.1 two-component sensor histidine kinase [Salipaludibacillus neizhouensis]
MTILLSDLQIFLLETLSIIVFYFIVSRFIKRNLHPLINEGLITLVAGTSIILCMTFSVNLTEGHIFDLRQIPFILGALYGGRRVAVVLFVILISYRFFIDGSGFYGAFIVNFLLLFSLWFIIPKFYQTFKIERKVKLATVAALLGVMFMALLVSLLFSELIDRRYIIFISLFSIAQPIGVIMFVSFIEKAKQDIILAGELRRLEKLQAVSDIAASISHEVRNPLTVTKGFLQLLREPNLTEEKRSTYIKYSLEELDRAEQIITDYLTFAKPSLENIEVLELDKELDYILKVVNPYATMNNVLIEVNIINNGYVTGEAEKLHQCLLNIIKNAIESIELEGQITITVDARDGMAKILIDDTGTGMSEEQINKLGTPYFSTKDKGTGLGTMVVFSIIKAMNGEIKVESEVGEGTRFIVTLPTTNHNSK